MPRGVSIPMPRVSTSSFVLISWLPLAREASIGHVSFGVFPTNGEPWKTTVESPFSLSWCRRRLGATMAAQGRERGEATDFRERVDESTASYFVEVERDLKQLVNDPEQQEAREALLTNAMEETQGKQLQTACDHRCSKPLEQLLQHASGKQLIEFLRGFGNSDKIVTLFTNPFGSHVAEALLQTLGEQLEYLDEAEWQQTKKLVTDAAQVLAEDVVKVAKSKYGSHALRTWVRLLSGQVGDIHTGAGKQRDMKGNAAWKGKKTIKGPFKELFQTWGKLVMKSVEGEMPTLLRHPSASPFLQAFLQACEGDEKLHRRALNIFIIKHVDANGSQPVQMDASEMTNLMKEKTSSHAVEALLASMPEELHHAFYTQVLRGNMLKLCLHPAANYPVQAFISSTTSEPLIGLVLEELGIHFGTLLQRQRAGVVAALVGASAKLRHERKATCQSLARGVLSCCDVIHEDSSSMNKNDYKKLVPLLLKLDMGGKNQAKGHKFGKKKRKREETKPPSAQNEQSFSVLGCQILTMVLSFPLDCCQQFVDSMTSLPEAELVEITCSPCGSRAVEAFFDSAAPSTSKKKLAAVFDRHLEDMCFLPGPSFVLQKAFSFADASTRESYAQKLAHHRSTLAGCRHGPHILRACGAEEYAADPKGWIEKQKRKSNQLKSFAKDFGDSTSLL